MKNLFKTVCITSLAAMALSSCGGDGPKDALDTYMDAVKNKDYKTVVDGMYFKDGLTESQRNFYVAAFEEKATKAETTNGKVSEYKITGDSIIVPDSLAIVYFETIYEDGKVEQEQQKMIYSDGKWKMYTSK